MPKRKVSDAEEDNFIASEEEESAISSGEDSTGDKKSKTSLAAKQKQKQKKASPPANKKVKAEVKEEDVGTSTKHESPDRETVPREVKIHTTSEGDKYIDLGKKKRAVVRSFKGVPLIDIREFYGADGQEKPGKKGIALTLEQWESLKGGTSAIDKLLEGLKKKK